MAIPAWLVAPWLGDRIGGSEPLVKALLICFNAGLIWMLLLTLILVRREQGGLGGPVCETRCGCGHPRIRRRGAWAASSSGGWSRSPYFRRHQLAPDRSDRADAEGPPPVHRHRPRLALRPGLVGWFALTAMVALLAPVTEEVFFRGLLLPRMRAVFGRGDWIANGAIFTVYHLHQPWSMPATLIDGIFAQAYPAKRFRSIWIGIVSHTVPSFVVIGVLLTLVLKYVALEHPALTPRPRSGGASAALGGPDADHTRAVLRRGRCPSPSDSGLRPVPGSSAFAGGRRARPSRTVG